MRWNDWQRLPRIFCVSKLSFPTAFWNKYIKTCACLFKIIPLFSRIGSNENQSTKLGALGWYDVMSDCKSRCGFQIVSECFAFFEATGWLSPVAGCGLLCGCGSASRMSLLRWLSGAALLPPSPSSADDSDPEPSPSASAELKEFGAPPALLKLHAWRALSRWSAQPVLDFAFGSIKNSKACACVRVK